MTEREIARKKAAARKARMERERKARNRRVVLTVCLMLAVCVASIGGTIAWLTDTTEEVKNTFSPSNIDLTLSEDHPTDGKANMIPGGIIEKNPKVTIENDVDAYLFVTIEESVNPDLDKYIAWDIDTSDGAWTRYSTTVKENADSHIYYRVVPKGVDPQSFFILKDNRVSVLTTVIKTDMDAISGENAVQPTLTFKAYAIQKESGNGISFTAAEAWAQLNPTTSEVPGEPESGT